MEQVRVALAWMAKYHFWLLSALVVLISTAAWYMAAGDLQQRKAENLQQISTAFSEQNRVKSRSLHPNENVNNQQRAQIVALANETRAVWQELYDRQREEVLKWPAQLPQSFRTHVADKQFGDEIDQLRREQYGDYIRGRFPDLPEIIDANQLDETRGGGGGFSRGGGGGFGGSGLGDFGANRQQEVDEFGNPIEVDYTVYWSDADQARIKADLDWQTTQSYWRIWVTQEDLWVYETMLRAIAATNEAKGANRQSNAAITAVAALQVGRDAAKESRTSGRIKRLESGARSLMGEGEFSSEMAATGAEPSEFGTSEFGESEFGRSGGEFGGTSGEGATLAEEKAIRLSGRYIDDAGVAIPMPPDEEPLAPDAFGQEVKRLPVRMVVQMDTRWLTMLMTQLANADLQIKVTEVRINPLNLDSSGGGGFRGGRGGGMGEFGGGRFGGGGFGGGQDIRAFDRKPYMKPVVIQGVVLIFNPPNDEVLNVDQAEAGMDVVLRSPAPLR